MSADPLKRQSKEVIEKYKTDFGRQCFQNRAKQTKYKKFQTQALNN